MQPGFPVLLSIVACRDDEDDVPLPRQLIQLCRPAVRFHVLFNGKGWAET